jgi:NhaP-type Na+/H+ and K+/H+ antiporter
MFDYTPKRADYGGGFMWIMWAVVMIAALVVAGFALNWFSKPAELFSPDRMEMLSRRANDNGLWRGYEQMASRQA